MVLSLQDLDLTPDKQALTAAICFMTSPSRFDAMMIQWSHMHNFDLGVSTCPHTDGFNLVNDFVIMFEDEEYVETIGKLLYGCQCLDMTHEEQAMMAAICVMCSPVTLTHVGCLIRDAALDTLGDAMIWLLRRSSDDSGVTFGKMINIITEFKALLERSLNECETRWVYKYADIFAQFDNVGCFYEMLGINNPMTESTETSDS